MISADPANRLAAATKIARLKGNVVLVLEGDIFSGQKGSFNLVTHSEEMRVARLFLQRNHSFFFCDFCI